MREGGASARLCCAVLGPAFLNGARTDPFDTPTAIGAFYDCPWTPPHFTTCTLSLQFGAPAMPLELKFKTVQGKQFELAFDEDTKVGGTVAPAAVLFLVEAVIGPHAGCLAAHRGQRPSSPP